MAPIHGVEQGPHLVPVPDVATLKLRQGHVTVVDVIKDRRNLHAQALPCIAFRTADLSSEPVLLKPSKRATAVAFSSSERLPFSCVAILAAARISKADSISAR